MRLPRPRRGGGLGRRREPSAEATEARKRAEQSLIEVEERWPAILFMAAAHEDLRRHNNFGESLRLAMNRNGK